MNILIIGTGYVGTTTGLVFCEMGHKVTGLDLDHSKLESLRAGKLHFYEPGLEDLLRKHLHGENITFTPEYEKAIKENDVIFICVGTPQLHDGNADLSYVKNAAESIGENLDSYKVIVSKSTVPVGTSEMIQQWIKAKLKGEFTFDVVSNPEFLREGSALKDALKPDRIVIGTSSQKANGIMKNLYKNFICEIVETTPNTSEMIKYAANSFLALKISYINELARLCDVLDIKIKDISRGIGLDHRIGLNFLNAGIGFGGSCFPKDVNALIKTSKDKQVNLSILERALEVNKTQTDFFYQQIRNSIGNLNGKTIVIAGLAFKSNTDDIRQSPSFALIENLLKDKAIVHVHDPVVKLERPELKQFNTVEEAAYQADALIICTEWDVYQQLNWMKIKTLMRQPYIFDGRNILDKEIIKNLGFYYKGVSQ
ncbi:UDP-glucose dehydrogenase family protein [Peribacillus deserti]|uniref:UDP-glucose 6-dehydrogenase n=1 Tax=Peribacillus deserti TaxID=673318 RepID=A0A2N5M0A2_9BACI|nr:UDP-glucose/GDP-mannose dehydrogenase family protein [Peribacillus deserti]PLT27796.1 nucleotide sugar dehydrogenase [Peribacillus deserti]